ncbi:MAG: hypothetical protein ACREE0_11675 [Phenylobacterium sp.]
MLRFLLLGLALTLAGCAARSANAPQQAVVESEAARQTAVDAVAAGASVDHALEKAAAEAPAGQAPRP